jgi:hypothetical protein
MGNTQSGTNGGFLGSNGSIFGANNGLTLNHGIFGSNNGLNGGILGENTNIKNSGPLFGPSPSTANPPASEIPATPSQ